MLLLSPLQLIKLWQLSRSTVGRTTVLHCTHSCRFTVAGEHRFLFPAALPFARMDTVNGVPVIGEDKHVDAGAAARRKDAHGLQHTSISHGSAPAPLDFSFQDIASMSELATHEPAGGNRKLPSSPSSSAAAASSSSSPTKSSSKSSVSGVRLAYNDLSSLKGFVEAMETLLGPDARTQLTWLDLSHNHLTSIDETVLLCFPNLTSLYLHGNAISDINEVRKLAALEKLSKFTIHGCPIYQERENHGLRNPRSAIIYHLRNCTLKSLDFITITNQDRSNAIRWAAQNKPKKKRAAGESEAQP